MKEPQLIVNPEKEEYVQAQNRRFACYAIPTDLITEQDNLEKLVLWYAKPLLQAGDILILSEKMVACTQGKAKPLDSIKPGRLARFLCRFVRKTDYGIGLAMPETMQCALNECGVFRILLASAAGAAGKLFRRKGWFYHVAGYKASAVDGPCAFTLPPYDRYVVPAPDRPNETASRLSEILGGPLVLIIDLNDIGGRILGSSNPDANLPLYLEVLRQNPLGQSHEQTPIGVIRPLST